MNRQETKQAIAVMQHYADGGKVEVTPRRYTQWESVTMPSWNWVSYRYRIKSCKPEVGKWYEIEDNSKLKCVAYEFGKYVFMDDKCYEDTYIYTYEEDNDFSIFKEVQP